eukprot:scaffold473_cov156-Amphora_coffeaeformis.AAC.9
MFKETQTTTIISVRDQQAIKPNRGYEINNNPHRRITSREITQYHGAPTVVRSRRNRGKTAHQKNNDTERETDVTKLGIPRSPSCAFRKIGRSRKSLVNQEEKENTLPATKEEPAVVKPTTNDA